MTFLSEEERSRSELAFKYFKGLLKYDSVVRYLWRSFRGRFNVPNLFDKRFHSLMFTFV